MTLKELLHVEIALLWQETELAMTQHPKHALAIHQNTARYIQELKNLTPEAVRLILLSTRRKK
jgi:hypothetical protein